MVNTLLSPHSDSGEALETEVEKNGYRRENSVPSWHHRR